MAKYIVDNKTTITAELMELKKSTLAKLKLEKVRLYESLEVLPLSDKLETYGQISDVLLRIEKLSKLSEMIDTYFKVAKKLSKEFDIVWAKELFLSILIQDLNVKFIISLGEKNIMTLQKVLFAPILLIWI
ncbi:MAG: hypothetical protein PHF05_07495 [Candidatus Izemoplasmatales bacterium]|nr:hypothetical protein [Candidatus Izemoplasmatales bacterium]